MNGMCFARGQVGSFGFKVEDIRKSNVCRLEPQETLWSGLSLCRVLELGAHGETSPTVTRKGKPWLPLGTKGVLLARALICSVSLRIQKDDSQ